MLDRDAGKRLGSKRDAEEIKEHPFFADINWDALYNREISAEYLPDTDREEYKEENEEGEDGGAAASQP